MDELLLVYTTWESAEQAKKAGKHLLEKRLCGCINIYPKMIPMFWWPPKANKIDESKEVMMMMMKTLKRKYEELEKEIYKIHTYDVPCIIAIPTYKVGKDYYDWIKGEIEMGEDKK
jgi:periplasmic divalent cation tolerance protein